MAEKRAEKAMSKEQKFRKAIRDRHFEKASLLITRDFQYNEADEYGNTALMVSCDFGAEQIVSDLLNNYSSEDAQFFFTAGQKAQGKLNINQPDLLGQTALMYAAFGGHYSIVKMMLEAGASINLKTTEGQNALMKACYTHYQHTTPLVTMLLDEGAEINAERKDGQTALMIASRSKNEQVVGLLVSRKADINAVDHKGETCLHHAARECCKPILTFLASLGVDTNAKNKNGHVAGDITDFEESLQVNNNIEALQKDVRDAIEAGLKKKKNKRKEEVKDEGDIAVF
mmetsp:Transcript_4232/g.8105  ORF Transcript_4232/g.8105 Transcript_4232/m.8105 type:complete len:286 (+) Transcript_4232:22-879(+)